MNQFPPSQRNGVGYKMAEENIGIKAMSVNQGDTEENE
jgi:hypothetical protein